MAMWLSRLMKERTLRKYRAVAGWWRLFAGSLIPRTGRFAAGTGHESVKRCPVSAPTAFGEIACRAQGRHLLRDRRGHELVQARAVGGRQFFCFGHDRN